MFHSCIACRLLAKFVILNEKHGTLMIRVDWKSIFILRSPFGRTLLHLMFVMKLFWVAVT